MSEWTCRVGLQQVGLYMLAASSLLAGLSCSGGDITQPTTATLKITTATTGPDPDPDGYAFAVDGGASQPIGINASASLADLTAGSHSVLLSGLATNCAVQGDDPRSVTLAGGASSDINFAVVCSGTTGSIQVTTVTTGAAPDPDGYTASVDGGAAQPIGINATLSLPNLAPGSHSVALAGLASNCKLAGDNPRSVTVAVGAMATVAFTVSCPTPVVARWTLMASGTTGFLASISGSSATNVFLFDESNTKLLHYDGTSWSSQPAPGVSPQFSSWGVWVNSATDAFAAAEGGGIGTFFHYDGQRWTSMVAPPVPPDRAGFDAGFSLWGSSGTNVFASGSWTTGLEFHPFLAHYDGTAWSFWDTRSFAGDNWLSNVWGTSANDVYVVGAGCDIDFGRFCHSAIYHFDGVNWSTVYVENSVGLGPLWGSSDSDIYATGFAEHDPDGPRTGAIRHFDGQRWSAIPSPSSNDDDLGPIWGSAADDIYIIANRHDVWHFDGASWKRVYTGTTSLSGIWGSSSTDVFVVGDKGTILHGTP